MNYQRIYDQIIDRAKSEERVKGGDVYYEAHHIIPKCMGGLGGYHQWKNHPNIILLTAREHFFCHLLLCKIYPENKKILGGLWSMCKLDRSIHSSRYTPSSRIIEYARSEFAKTKIGNKNCLGKIPSKFTKDKIAAALKGNTNGAGSRTEETKQKMKKPKGPMSEEHKEKLRNSLKGRTISPEVIQNMKDGHKKNRLALD
jgi:hypothetical protein